MVPRSGFPTIRSREESIAEYEQTRVSPVDPDEDVVSRCRLTGVLRCSLRGQWNEPSFAGCALLRLLWEPVSDEAREHGRIARNGVILVDPGWALACCVCPADSAPHIPTSSPRCSTGCVFLCRDLDLGLARKISTAALNGAPIVPSDEGKWETADYRLSLVFNVIPHALCPLVLKEIAKD